MRRPTRRPTRWQTSSGKPEASQLPAFPKARARARVFSFGLEITSDSSLALRGLPTDRYSLARMPEAGRVAFEHVCPSACLAVARPPCDHLPSGERYSPL